MLILAAADHHLLKLFLLVVALVLLVPTLGLTFVLRLLQPRIGRANTRLLAWGLLGAGILLVVTWGIAENGWNGRYSGSLTGLGLLGLLLAAVAAANALKFDEMVPPSSKERTKRPGRGRRTGRRKRERPAVPAIPTPAEYEQIELQAFMKMATEIYGFSEEKARKIARKARKQVSSYPVDAPEWLHHELKCECGVTTRFPSTDPPRREFPCSACGAKGTALSQIMANSPEHDARLKLLAKVAKKASKKLD